MINGVAVQTLNNITDLQKVGGALTVKVPRQGTEFLYHSEATIDSFGVQNQPGIIARSHFSWAFQGSECRLALSIALDVGDGACTPLLNR